MGTNPKTVALRTALAQVDPGLTELLEVLITAVIRLLAQWLAKLLD